MGYFAPQSRALSLKPRKKVVVQRNKDAKPFLKKREMQNNSYIFFLYTMLLNMPFSQAKLSYKLVPS